MSGREDLCKSRTSYGHGMGYQMCSRRAKVEGYCHQHHPDAVKARHDAQAERARAEARQASRAVDERRSAFVARAVLLDLGWTWTGVVWEEPA